MAEPLEYSPTAPGEPVSESYVGPTHSHGHAMNPHNSEPETAAPETEEVPGKDEPLTECEEVRLQRSSGDSVSMIVYGKDTVHHVKEKGGHIHSPAKPKHSGPSYGKQGRVTALPSGIDLNNVIDPESKEDENLLLEKTQPTSSAPTSSYTLRNRGVKQSKLAYDLKYHPMDDSIRPTQAAKRRSVHGEKLQCSDDLSDSSSDHAGTDADSPVLGDDESEIEMEEGPKQVTRRMKRNRTQSQRPEATRRSSRKTSDPKMSYNMAVHPQDEELEMLSADEGEVHVPAHKRRRLACTHPEVDGSSSNDRVLKAAKAKHLTSAQVIDMTRSDTTDVDQEPTFLYGDSVEGASGAHDALGEMCSPMSSIGTAPSYDISSIRRKEGLDVWKMLPGERYFRHDRDSLPILPGQPFEIWAERLEDQLAAEALAASPLNYEHDDKENNVNTSETNATSDPLEGVSVMPASQYRRSSEDNQVSRHIALTSHTFYDNFEEYPQPHGFGGSDGAHDEQIDAGGTSPLPDFMRILASSEQLPRDPAGEEALLDGHDSVIGSTSSSSAGNMEEAGGNQKSVDSVLGEPSLV